jgi:mannose-6-phosphate isomerase-like protein (cupin superfamily)
MVQVDYENLPKQVGYRIDLEKTRGNHHKAVGEEPEFDITQRVFGSNEFDIAYIEGPPGRGFAWHNHAPTLYQVYIPMSGEVEILFKGNDGKTKEMTANKGQMLYLPPGARNKVRAVGEEPLELLVVGRELKITRVDQVIDESSDEVYNPHDDPEYLLNLDPLRGTVVDMDERAVEEV